MAQKMDDIDKVEKEAEISENSINKRMSSIVFGVVGWASVVTIALIVIIAVVYRKLRHSHYSSSASSSAMSILSDAESGSTAGSSFDYDKRSIVDFDGQFDGEEDANFDEGKRELPSLPATSSTHVPINVNRLDSELNENTMEHIAAMHDEDSPPEVADVHDKNHLTTSRHKFRHATFNGLKMNNAGSGSSFL